MLKQFWGVILIFNNGNRSSVVILRAAREACILARAARGQHTPQRDDGNPSASLRLAAWDLRSQASREDRVQARTRRTLAPPRGTPGAPWDLRDNPGDGQQCPAMTGRPAKDLFAYQA